jgi:hypothetical protein
MHDVECIQNTMMAIKMPSVSPLFHSKIQSLHLQLRSRADIPGTLRYWIIILISRLKKNNSFPSEPHEQKSSDHNSLYCVVQNDLASLATVIMASRCAKGAPNAASRHCGPYSDTAQTKIYSSMPYNDFYSIREFHIA